MREFKTLAPRILILLSFLANATACVHSAQPTSPTKAQPETTISPAPPTEPGLGAQNESEYGYAKPPAGLGSAGAAEQPNTPANGNAPVWREQAKNKAAPDGWANDHLANNDSEPSPAPPRAEKKSARPSDSEYYRDDSGVAGGGLGAAAGAARSSAPLADMRPMPMPPMPMPVRPRPPVVEERPGLATVWGENRYSPVTHVSFERDSTRPTSSASLWYNDRHGSELAAARDGYVSLSSAAVGLGNGLSLSVQDEWGRTLRGFRSGGRTYAIGENGARYSLIIHNRGVARYEVVVSVDGLDVLDGEPASPNKTGYVIPAYGSLQIDGFRRSDAEVAAFRFGSVNDSYAARTGNAHNVGVIGIAAFVERGSDPMYSAEINRRNQANPFPGYAYPPTY